MANRVFQCLDCNHQWEVEPCTEGGKHGYEIPCPTCGSEKKLSWLKTVHVICAAAVMETGTLMAKAVVAADTRLT